MLLRKLSLLGLRASSFSALRHYFTSTLSEVRAHPFSKTHLFVAPFGFGHVVCCAAGRNGAAVRSMRAGGGHYLAHCACRWAGARARSTHRPFLHTACVARAELPAARKRLRCCLLFLCLWLARDCFFCVCSVQPPEAARMEVANAFDMLHVLRERLPADAIRQREYAFARRTFGQVLSDDLYELSHEHDVRTSVCIMRQRPVYDVLHLYCNSTKLGADCASFLGVMVSVIEKHSATAACVFDTTDPTMDRFMHSSMQLGFDVHSAWQLCAGLEQGHESGPAAARDFEFMHALLLHSPVKLLSALLRDAAAVIKHRDAVLCGMTADLVFLAMLYDMRDADWRCLHGLLQATRRCRQFLDTMTDFRDARERFGRENGTGCSGTVYDVDT